MLSKMVYGPFIGIKKNYFNGILHLLERKNQGCALMKIEGSPVL